MNDFQQVQDAWKKDMLYAQKRAKAKAMQHTIGATINYDDLIEKLLKYKSIHVFNTWINSNLYNKNEIHRNLSTLLETYRIYLHEHPEELAINYEYIRDLKDKKIEKLIGDSARYEQYILEFLELGDYNDFHEFIKDYVNKMIKDESVYSIELVRLIELLNYYNTLYIGEDLQMVNDDGSLNAHRGDKPANSGGKRKKESKKIRKSRNGRFPHKRKSKKVKKSRNGQFPHKRKSKRRRN